jgi:hypothetical protein
MLQYTIERGTGAPGCCGRLGADIESDSCDAPTISVLKHTPAEAKAVGQQAWTETRGGMYMVLPRTLCMAGWFKALQRAVNLYAAKNPTVTPAIRVDARIGPETLAAVQKIAVAQGEEPPATVDDLATGYYGWTVNISDFAGVPINAAPEPKPSSNEMQQLVDDETAKKSGLPTGKGWWSWGKWVVLTAMGVGAAALGYSIYRTKKKQQPRYARRRFPTRVRRGI